MTTKKISGGDWTTAGCGVFVIAGILAGLVPLAAGAVWLA